MDVKIIHKGTIINGKRVYDYPKVHKSQIDLLEGKRFEEILEPEHLKVTISQWGYYRAGIIRASCMKAEVFSGWTETEIEESIRKHLRTNNKIVILPDGKEIIMQYTDDLRLYSQGKMAIYLDDVLNFLGTMDIQPLPPDYYKYGINIETKKKKK